MIRDDNNPFAGEGPLDLACYYCGISAGEAFATVTKEANNAVAFAASVDPLSKEVFACGECARKHGVTLRHGTMAQWRNRGCEHKL